MHRTLPDRLRNVPYIFICLSHYFFLFVSSLITGPQEGGEVCEGVGNTPRFAQGGLRGSPWHKRKACFASSSPQGYDDLLKHTVCNPWSEFFSPFIADKRLNSDWSLLTLQRELEGVCLVTKILKEREVKFAGNLFKNSMSSCHVIHWFTCINFIQMGAKHELFSEGKWDNLRSDP